MDLVNRNALNVSNLNTLVVASKNQLKNAVLNVELDVNCHVP